MKFLLFLGNIECGQQEKEQNETLLRWTMRQVTSKRDFSCLEAAFNLLKHYSVSCASLSLLRCTGFSRAFRDFMQDWNLFLKQGTTSSRGQGAVHTTMPWILVFSSKESTRIEKLDRSLSTNTFSFPQKVQFSVLIY